MNFCGTSSDAATSTECPRASIPSLLCLLSVTYFVRMLSRLCMTLCEEVVYGAFLK